MHPYPKRALASWILLLTTAGCGDSGANRHDIWGTVTWRGEPVPSGLIYLSPNSKKGNSGPQGCAVIKEGKFDTRAEGGKGGVGGPVIATVDGCDGKPADYLPYGKSLFANRPQIEIQVPDNGGEINIVVPNDATAAPSNRADGF